ncbi:MAG: hypothetical protein sL5_01160 [Candidatus Mesenet longicola]|uniref:Uncharacterized protein n=1 Tax=Candidatus Mesenet longicola TaxID=1892558 RepID=A0A8J3HRT1_9RICK|nr:MAG: hypothetical protein sGL2_01200 [Candidatus Mesenet longicola]GHM59123.1 MAG: hypothetical protein sL5_01160 [Candidatus Mesenet longicola]
MPKKFTTYPKNNEVEKFSEQIEDIAYRTQVKFSNNIDDIADSNLNRFNDLLRKELNLAIKNVYSQNIELLKSSFAKQFLDSEALNFLSRKGKVSLTQLLFNILQNISKNHINL